MKAQQQIHYLDWQGVSLSVTYCPSWSKAYETSYGHPIAHLEVKTHDRGPLPITETGYRSLFIPAGDVEREGGPVAYAIAWLDEAAKHPAWRAFAAVEIDIDRIKARLDLTDPSL